MTAPSQPAQRREINRAQVVDDNFLRFVRSYQSDATASDAEAPIHSGTSLTGAELLRLFDSQMASRQMDLMARVKRLENKVFYTIGSSGHEGNVLLGRLTRHTDPAFLHYRSGGFMAERARQSSETDFIRDTALSFAASRNDPASGGRHKVWGSKPLWVLPQTSTIASHLPKAVGTALAVPAGKRLLPELPVPDDSIVVCSFGDASLNHSTAQGAINAAQWSAHQSLPVPVLFVCEDNGIGISVRSPSGWVERNMRGRAPIHYVQADGLDLSAGWDVVKNAVDTCRRRRVPVFLHLKTVRLMGHAGTDFEIEYRDMLELEAAEALDPLLLSARRVMDVGLMEGEAIAQRYEALRDQCLEAADWADAEPRLESYEQVAESLAPSTPTKVAEQASSSIEAKRRIEVFGSLRGLPENQPPRHLAVQINRALHDLMIQYPNACLFGEDVARKGGVYTVTKGLQKKFGGHRVFNTLLDEQTILGLAQGYANMGMLPIPEIQYLAYFHNACDQIRGEASSLQFFSDNQFQNPMVMRIASLGYQKGFGGHFHNDNSFAALRDIPGLTIACPSRGDDAAMMLRTLMAMAQVDGRVSAFLEPIALYMTKDLYEENDEQWLFDYPEPERFIPPGEGRVYFPENHDQLIVTYGNGVPMSLKAAKRLSDEHGLKSRILDLRWLNPINTEQLMRHAAECDSVLIVDEGRRTGGISEALMCLITEGTDSRITMARVVGADCYTPLGAAASTVLPSVASVVKESLALSQR